MKRRRIWERDMKWNAENGPTNSLHVHERRQKRNCNIANEQQKSPCVNAVLTVDDSTLNNFLIIPDTIFFFFLYMTYLSFWFKINQLSERFN